MNVILSYLCPAQAPAFSGWAIGSASVGVVGNLSYGSSNTISADIGAAGTPPVANVAGTTAPLVNCTGSMAPIPTALNVDGSIVISGTYLRRGIFSTALAGFSGYMNISTAASTQSPNPAYPQYAFNVPVSGSTQGFLALYVNNDLIPLYTTQDLSLIAAGTYTNGNGSGFVLLNPTYNTQTNPGTVNGYYEAFPQGQVFTAFAYRVGWWIAKYADMEDGWNFVRISHVQSGNIIAQGTGGSFSGSGSTSTFTFGSVTSGSTSSLQVLYYLGITSGTYAGAYYVITNVGGEPTSVTVGGGGIPNGTQGNPPGSGSGNWVVVTSVPSQYVGADVYTQYSDWVIDKCLTVSSASGEYLYKAAITYTTQYSDQLLNVTSTKTISGITHINAATATYTVTWSNLYRNTYNNGTALTYTCTTGNAAVAGTSTLSAIAGISANTATGSVGSWSTSNWTFTFSTYSGSFPGSSQTRYSLQIISGTGLTPGFYPIVSANFPTSCVLSVSPGASVGSVSWQIVGFQYATMTPTATVTVSAGMRINPAATNSGSNYTYIKVTSTAQRTVQGPQTSSGVSNGNNGIPGIILDTYAASSTIASSSASTTCEQFADEQYRMASNYTFTSAPSRNSLTVNSLWTTSNYLSSATTGYSDGLQIYNGTLIYPSYNFSTYGINSTNNYNYGVSNTNYSTCTGQRTYHRWFNWDGNGHNAFILQLNGSGCVIEPYGTSLSSSTGQMIVCVMLPGLTGWMDISQTFTAGHWLDGNGCLQSGTFSFNANNNLYFGTANVSNSSYYAWIRITVPQGWTGNLTGIIMYGN